MCLPLLAGERHVAVAVLADRVNGAPYSVEELDLLKCIGDQTASGLLNLLLTDDLMVDKDGNDVPELTLGGFLHHRWSTFQMSYGFEHLTLRSERGTKLRPL